jgi:hypothetical protein
VAGLGSPKPPTGLTGVAGQTLNFSFFFLKKKKNLGWGYFEKKKRVRMIELQQFESLRGKVSLFNILG